MIHRLIVGRHIKVGDIGISIYHPIKIANCPFNPTVVWLCRQAIPWATLVLKVQCGCVTN